MEMATRTDPDPFAPILEGCLAALADETDAVRGSLAARGLARPLVGFDGRLRDEAGSGFAYEWTLADGSAKVRIDDAVQVRCQAGESSGFVIGFERKRRRVAVATQEWLGTNTMPPLAFSGYRALLLLLRESPDFIPTIPTDVWKKWTPTILA